MTPCPKCGAPTACRFRVLYLIGAVLCFPFGLALLVLDKKGRCPRCGAEVSAEGMKLE